MNMVTTHAFVLLAESSLTSTVRWPRPTKMHPRHHSLPSQQFQALLTLFSKFFSSFPRGTCSLSVSRPYLALGGIYHPFRAAFPNNPTRGQRFVEPSSQNQRGCHPLWRSVPGNLVEFDCRSSFSRLQFGKQGFQIFKLGFSLFARRY